MTTATPRGLPLFLRYARTYPTPDLMAAALQRGPLASWGARTGSIWRLEADQLVSVARFGATVEEGERYARIPISLDFDISVAVRSRQPIIGPAHEVGDTRIGIIDGEFWNGLVDRVEGVSLISAPLVLDGEAVGGFGFLTDAQWPGDDESRDALALITTALTLWLTHPLSPVPATVAPTGQSEWSLFLTDRQADIMRRVEQGQHNSQIAASLHLSASTVKQEVQHVMRTMRSSDRHTAAERVRLLGLM